MEGRRYKDEPAPINDSLERHYKDEIKRLEVKISELERALNEEKLEVERLNTRVRMKDKQIWALLDKIVEE